MSTEKKYVGNMLTLPLLFSFKGRIGRLQFSKWFLPLTFFPAIVFPFNSILAIWLFIAFLWPLFALTTKRYHDFNNSGWLGIFQLLPLGGWIIVFAGCCFTIGDFKDNRFGRSIYQK